MAPFTPQVCVVGFHHQLGPQIEFWVTPEGQQLYDRNEWQLLPFMALSDVRGMGELRTRLRITTQLWFAQRDFGDVELLKRFQESLGGRERESEGERYFGMSLREVIHEFRSQTLVLVKALLLQRKILFFGSKCERLCLLQFALLSLMPGLLSHLETSAHPSLSAPSSTDRLETIPEPPTDARSSLLSTLGFPLRIFDTGSFFSPYTPLQHLDILASYSTKSYVVGSTNPLLLQQKERYADLLVNLDEENSITILSPSLQQALRLSAADRRWIDGITQTVQDTWDEERTEQPRDMGYRGSEEEIRMMFEEYILSLCSATKNQTYIEEQKGKPLELSQATEYKRPSEDTVAPSTPVTHHPNTPPPTTPDPPLSPSRYPQSVSLHQTEISPSTNATDFHPQFLTMWRTTRNFEIFHLFSTRQRIFDIIEPRHPTSGALTYDDISRRLTQGVSDLRTRYDVDERYKEGRERMEKVVGVVGDRWREGIKRVREEVERRRAAGDGSGDAATTTAAGGEEVGREREKENRGVEEEVVGSDEVSVASSTAEGGGGWQAALRARATNLQARASELQKPDTAAVQAAAREASAYLSSWRSWAKEKAEARTPRRKGADREGTGLQ